MEPQQEGVALTSTNTNLNNNSEESVEGESNFPQPNEAKSKTFIYVLLIIAFIVAFIIAVLVIFSSSSSSDIDTDSNTIHYSGSYGGLDFYGYTNETCGFQLDLKDSKYNQSSWFRYKDWKDGCGQECYDINGYSSVFYREANHSQHIQRECYCCPSSTYWWDYGYDQNADEVDGCEFDGENCYKVYGMYEVSPSMKTKMMHVHNIYFDF